MEELLNGHDDKIMDIKRDIIVINGSYSLLHLLKTFLDEKEQIALVVDEYGGLWA